jgi:transcriptional regulator with XRE-family HTH domain
MGADKFEILEKAGVSQREFAELVGVSRVTVNNWSRGKQKPSNVLSKIAQKQLAYITVAYRLDWLPGDIPRMHRTNVEARKQYISAKLDDAAEKIRQKRQSA